MAVALTIFGTPKGTDAIISPSGFSLPDELFRVVDAKFLFHDQGEVFRLKKLKVGSSSLRFYSILTRAWDMRGPRDGAFIGAGVFAHADEIMDAVVLVECLRKMLRNAMEATVVNGHFVKTISESANQIRIPDEFDRLLTSQVRPTVTFDAGADSALCFIPLKGGPLETPEALIALNETMPGVLPDSLYFSADPRCEADCLKDSDFQVISLAKLLSSSVEYQGAVLSNAQASAEKIRVEFSQRLAVQAQQLELALTEKQAADASFVSLEKKNLSSQALIDKLRIENRQLKSSQPGNSANDSTSMQQDLPLWVLGLMAVGALSLLLVLGFGAYNLGTFILSFMTPNPSGTVS